MIQVEGGVVFLSMVLVSEMELPLLVTDLPLVWECILVMSVVWRVGGSAGASKIRSSGVLV